MKNNCIYFVEGQCEKKLIEALKEEPQRLRPGKIKVWNLIKDEIPSSILLTIKEGSVVVLVFDTDVLQTDKLKKNIQNLKTRCKKINIVYLAQVLNLEDELVRCTDVSKVQDLTNSNSKREFKRDFCSMTNCRQILDRHHLDVERLWNSRYPDAYGFISNNSLDIKQKYKENIGHIR